MLTTPYDDVTPHLNALLELAQISAPTCVILLSEKETSAIQRAQQIKNKAVEDAHNQSKEERVAKLREENNPQLNGDPVLW